MLELKVIRKNKNNCELVFYNVEREFQDIWKIKNKVITISYGRKVIYLRVFNKLYSSKFVAGDLDCYL
jgi:3-dehydroquinate dehydratase